MSLFKSRLFTTSVLLLSLFLLNDCGTSHKQVKSSKKNVFEEEHPSFLDPNKAPKGNPYYSYMLSKLSLFEGDLNGSLYHLDQALAENPKSSFLKEEQAEQFLQANRIEESFEAIRQAVDLNPSNTNGRLLLGKLYLATKQFDKAEEEFREILKLSPQSEDAYSELIRTALSEKNEKKIDEALKIIQESKKNLSNSSVGSYWQGIIYTSFRPNPTNAISAFKEVQEESPRFVEVQQILGQLYIQQKKLEEAAQVYELLTQKSPNDIQLLLKLGLIQFERKNYEKAIDSFRQILQIVPDSDRVSYYLGTIYLAQKNEALAQSYYQKIPVSSQFYKDATIQTALYYHSENNDAKTAEILLEGIKKNPNSSAFYEALGNFYISQKEYDLGLNLLKEATARFPQEEKLLFLQGVIYDKKDEQDSALEKMQKVLEINPDNASALNYIGYSYAEKGIRLDEAIELLKKANALKPEDGHILDSLGWAHFQKGDLKKAKEQLEQAFAKNPDEPEILEHLGDLYHKIGNPQKAKEYYRKALKNLENKSAEKETKKTIERIRQKLS